MIRMIILIGAIVLLTISGLAQMPENSTTATASAASTTTSWTRTQAPTEISSTVKTLVQARTKRQVLTPTEKAAVEKAVKALSSRMTPKDKEFYESYLGQLARMGILVPPFNQHEVDEYFLAMEIVEGLLNGIEWYVNVPVSTSTKTIATQCQLPCLPALQPCNVLVLDEVPMPCTTSQPAPAQQVCYYVQQPCATPVASCYQARFPYESQGPTFQGYAIVGWERQPKAAPPPKAVTPPPGTPPCDPLGVPNTAPPPVASNVPVGSPSGPTIVDCPLPPGSIPSNVPQTQPGFVPGGVGAGGSPATSRGVRYY